MTNEFVTFEIAKKLKEKGFRGLCLVYYTNDDTLYYNYSHKVGASYIDCYLSHNLMPKDSVSGKFVDAPTISQVLKWLREEKEIDIIIDLIITYNYNLERIREYSCRIYTSKLNKPKTTDCFKSFEQAAIDGIKYIIDNLI